MYSRIIWQSIRAASSTGAHAGQLISVGHDDFFAFLCHRILGEEREQNRLAERRNQREKELRLNQAGQKTNQPVDGNLSVVLVDGRVDEQRDDLGRVEHEKEKIDDDSNVELPFGRVQRGEAFDVEGALQYEQDQVGRDRLDGRCPDDEAYVASLALVEVHHVDEHRQNDVEVRDVQAGDARLRREQIQIEKAHQGPLSIAASNPLKDALAKRFNVGRIDRLQGHVGAQFCEAFLVLQQPAVREESVLPSE